MTQASFRVAALVAALTALTAPVAEAGSRSGTLSVKAKVSNACAVGTATLDFGTYYAGATSNRDAAGSIGYVNCYSSSVVIELDDGQNASGSSRFMKSGSSLLGYEIYQDSARTKVLSTGSNAKSLKTDADGSGSVRIYGRIFKGQVVSSGTYADTVGIVITF